LRCGTCPWLGVYKEPGNDRKFHYCLNADTPFFGIGIGESVLDDGNFCDIDRKGFKVKAANNEGRPYK
jgi:hypothetical protein